VDGQLKGGENIDRRKHRIERATRLGEEKDDGNVRILGRKAEGRRGKIFLYKVVVVSKKLGSEEFNFKTQKQIVKKSY